jgi:peptide deformylase
MSEEEAQALSEEEEVAEPEDSEEEEVAEPEDSEEEEVAEPEEPGYEGQICELLLYGDPCLNQKCQKVEEVDEGIHRLAADLAATLVSYNGYGLSAPQIGRGVRVILTIWEEERDDGDLGVVTMINPEILSDPEEDDKRFGHMEGCLSIPGAHGTVQRLKRIRVRYMGLDENHYEQMFLDESAAAIQHEMDHLDGILFTDRLSPFQRSRALQKHRKVMKQAYRQTKRVRRGR